MDKNVEDQMKQTLDGLKDDRRKFEEEQFNKFWAEISVPLTLQNGLNKYTKNELGEIRKHLGIKNASNLKKADLAALLQERIPEHLENICFLFDTERFKMLTKIADKGGYISAPNLKDEQIDYLRATGFLYTGTYNGEKIVAVPDELIETIRTLKNYLNLRASISRNTDWIKLSQGLLYYYGTLTATQLVEMVEEYTKEPIEFGAYLDVISEANAYRHEIYINEDGFSTGRILDPKRVKQEHQARSGLDYYPFTKQQLLAAGEPEFVDRNKSYLNLVNFLVKNFEVDRSEADEMVEECVYATRIGDSPNNILTFLSYSLEFDNGDAVRALMDKVVDLMNNTREWFLKGYTSNELSKQEKKKEANHNGKTVVKVGRNDPCPCGSGKKYKKCCGR
ncbi:hypothetical protein CFK37_19820 [Virgibacillus phasianinus]|uniref:Zinc chelation protein SecC n=2 Tax=Virgibacillus phasianinus TaxID=2017483 RepID=A0A220U9E3_9BACI|nr:hypothetical protein CFK37_19820 [Virgibacillus phasianinus]